MIKRFLMAVAVVVAPGLAAAEPLSLNEISNYLNTLETARADFRQINDDGSVSTGVLYLWRPWRMRFEYDPPNDGLVIAEARAVKIFDRKSNTRPDTYPLNRTPLSLILEPDINLAAERMVVGQVYDGTATIVTVQDPRRPETGTIRMRFTGDPVALRDWVIETESGGQTQVILSGLQTGMELPSSLFSADQKSRSRYDR